jgi:3-deoxy-7-phosphoheptulonate synthase
MTNVQKKHILSPIELKNSLPFTKVVETHIQETRHAIGQVITGASNKKLVICGPCSIDDIESALQFGEKLKSLSSKLPNLIIIMRCYFEKPRSVSGWKGFYDDPFLDESYNTVDALKQARSLLIKLNKMGLGVATEFVNPLLHHYSSDLISWGCIGARTVESQTHRELAASLPFPVGFKNSTRGNIEAAINAIRFATTPQSIVLLDEEQQLFSTHVEGNPFTHVVLRGGSTTPNYYPLVLNQVSKRLKNAQIKTRLIIDCNHGNSKKAAKNQRQVVDDIINQSKPYQQLIAGIMLESYLHEGKQPATKQRMKGKSITDDCLSWSDTEVLLKRINQAL